jgi:hypothetical protein
LVGGFVFFFLVYQLSFLCVWALWAVLLGVVVVVVVVVVEEEEEEEAGKTIL